MLRSKRHPSKFPERKQRFYDFLSEHPIGVLSTVTPNGEPHGVVIYFTIDDDLALSFLTRVGTRKHDNLKHNQQVMLTVFEPKALTTAQIVGKAYEITDSYNINHVAGSVLAAGLKHNLSGLLPITKLSAGPYTAYRIKPSQLRMAAYAHADPGSYQELFESVESFELEGMSV